MQEFIVNVYVSLMRLRRNNYQDFALPLHKSKLHSAKHSNEFDVLHSFAKTLHKSKLHSAKHSSELDVLHSFAKTLYPKAVPLTPTLIYWN